MQILLLGGTGAMGVSLKTILAERGDEVFITSRSPRKSERKNIHYIQGDAHNSAFLKEILKSRYDAIVDFMIYESDEFKKRSEQLLNASGQYIFVSSSRVYADSKETITEESPRLLDVIGDKEYLRTDEYALAKAREENVLFFSKQRNWTIIRPYITYNVERLQLGGIEKDVWLYRALHGRSIPLPQNIALHQTTMTYGGDVALAIVKLIGNPKALREVFHLTGNEHMTWSEILDIYLEVMASECGIRPKVYTPENSIRICEIMGNKYQIEYDRLYDRIFDNSKLCSVCGDDLRFMPMKDGLSMCLREFLKNPKWKNIVNEKLEVHLNKESEEKIALNELHGVKSKLKYFGWKYTPWILDTVKRVWDKG